MILSTEEIENHQCPVLHFTDTQEGPWEAEQPRAHS